MGWEQQHTGFLQIIVFTYHPEVFLDKIRRLQTSEIYKPWSVDVRFCISQTSADVRFYLGCFNTKQCFHFYNGLKNKHLVKLS